MSKKFTNFNPSQTVISIVTKSLKSLPNEYLAIVIQEHLGCFLMPFSMPMTLKGISTVKCLGLASESDEGSTTKSSHDNFSPTTPR